MGAPVPTLPASAREMCSLTPNSLPACQASTSRCRRRGQASETIRLLDEAGSPATVASNGPNYFGFVIGATLPVAAAAERIAVAWDQCASSFANSPAADGIEKTAAKWVLEALDLPS